MKEIKTKTKIALGVVAGAVCAAVVFAVTLPFFKTETVVKETETIEKLVIVPNTPNGVELCSTTIDVDDYATYGVSETAESAKLLTVEMNPAGTSTLFDWAIVWSNPDSTWATGKTVSNYMTISPTSDGSNEAVLTCLQPYGQQIILTATSRTNSALTVSATIDYDLKFNGINFDFNFDSTAVSKLGVSSTMSYDYSTTDITLPCPTVVGVLGNFGFNVYGQHNDYSNSSELLPPNGIFAVGLYVKCSDSFAEQLTAQGLTPSTEYVSATGYLGTTISAIGPGYVEGGYTQLDTETYGDYSLNAWGTCHVAGIYGSLCSEVVDISKTTSYLVDFIEAAKNTSGYHFEISVRVYPYGSAGSNYADLTRPVETIYKVTFSSETLTVVEPSSVAMDNAALVF